MGYLDQSQMAGNAMMFVRVAQCAAEQDAQPDADTWTAEHRREWAAAPGWDAAWASALAGHTDDRDYDPGSDEAVITDPMILSQVQSMVASG
jgi:hypothetical protein